MKSNTKQKLTKSNNRVFAGVLGGIAEYLNWNANVLRVLYVILTLITHGFGLLVYLLLMTIIPSKPENTGFFEQMRQSAGQPTQATKHGRKEIHNVHEEDEPRHQD
ncbi:PspC domain-containing protein [Lactiplantibacillus pentosus]|uniref:PspC domain-containing protein n=1 Tax=Lactiplantibacillus pentosus TaxID=1589 RepID=UPI0013305AD4|nr:PspC domain-containing protein [Lactiplantibacillus pentosus]MBQ0836356.1 PspC domain-containing protein [Lactiplantibacillus pentosus]MBU7463241.1 PspC domain-containing protein [Lactiplantibacillus pentosus]MBU7489139.1 PspC domain-containing protein [Lactiplantibacillus pentosus]MBU7492838.1 PspC domain-containing protein [Lactiplantibacillus pentosus]MBU7518845.1 PspC domain-containing protein [Lactiplantibacillus pentosus]